MTALTPARCEAQATGVSCSVSSSDYLNFGAIDLYGGNTNNSIPITYSCGATAAPSGVAYLRLCIYMNSGNGGSSVAPRLMSASNNSSGLTMQYNLYSDAARTQIIGPQGNGSYPAFTWTVQMPVTNYYATSSGMATIYAQVPSGQTSLISSPYTYFQSSFAGNAAVLQYAWSPTATPATCSGGSGTGTSVLNVQVQANIQSGCFISSASNLDFGSTSSVTSGNIDSSSVLGVACTTSGSWQVGIGPGINYADGVRHVVGPGGSLLAYDLYSNSGRTQPWGDTLNSNTVTGNGGTSTQLTVYGRVPQQAVGVPPGTYSDTVTVTLTY